MLKALVLIGGSSSRMGSDKFLMEINGKPQYLHLYHMISDLGIPTFISCTSDQTNKIPEDIPLLIDEFKSIGPIGGLATAIKHDPDTDWLVVACDLINLQPGTIQEVIRQNKGKGIVTFQKEESTFPETTITIYCTDVFETVGKCCQSGKKQFTGYIEIFKRSQDRTHEPLAFEKCQYKGGLTLIAFSYNRPFSLRR